MALVAFVLAAWVAFAFSFTPLRTSHDEFWHLKTGQWICEHGRLPEKEIFTYTADHLKWSNHEWLTQVVMWRLYQWGEAYGLGGLRAVILLKTICIILAFAGFGLLLARGMGEPLWAALAAALMAALARRTFYPRPPFVSYLLMAVVLWVFIAWRGGRLRGGALWLLGPLFALWSNLHGGWQAGLVIVGAFGADALARLVWPFGRKRSDPALRRQALGMTGVLAVCVLGSLVNPYGWRLYELSARVMNDPYLASTIGEMMPPDWNFVWVLEGVILLAAALAIRPVRGWDLGATALLLALLHFALRYALQFPSSAWLQTAIALPILAAMIVRLRPPAWIAHFLLVWFFAYQGIHHVRHLPLLALVLLPTLAWSLEAWAGGLAAWWARDPASAGKGFDDDDEHERERGRLHRMQRATALGGLIVLVGLSGYWNFSRRETPYFQRNMVLMQGVELEPAFVDTRRIDWPIPSTLPQGIFRIDPYPVQAVNYLLRARLPGPLWCGGNYAGYLIWRLAPERYKIFTDNRYDIYGGLVIKQEHAALSGWDEKDLAAMNARPHPKWVQYTRAGGFIPWNEVLDGWPAAWGRVPAAQTVFIPADARLNVRLVRGGWVRVWEDYAFTIWVRDTPVNRAAIQRARTIEQPPKGLPRYSGS